MGFVTRDELDDLNNRIGQQLDSGAVDADPSSLTLPSEYNPTHPGLGLTESPTTGGAVEQGLGLAQRGLEAITPSRDTLYKFAQGLEAAGAVGRGATPLYLQQQHQDLQRQQMASAAEDRKQMVALRIQEQQEQKRQHDMGLLEKTIGGTQPPGTKKAMLDQLGSDPNFIMAPQARQLSKAMKDTDFDSFEVYKEFIPEDVQAKFVAGKLPQAELSAWVDHARDAAKVNAKETAKVRIVKNALDKDPKDRTPYEAQLAEEHIAATELKRSTMELQQSQIKKNLSEAERGPGDKGLGHDREAKTQELFGRGTKYGDLSQPQMAAVNNAVAGFQGQIASGRATGRIEAQQAQEVGHDAVNWMDDEGNFPPPGISVNDVLHGGKYRPITQGSMNFSANANAAYQTIQQYKNVLNNVLVHGTGNPASDAIAIAGNRARLALLRRSGDESVRQFDQLSINAPLIARATGDTGNVAVAERQMLEGYIADESKDTVESAMARLRQAESTLGNILKSRKIPAPWMNQKKSGQIKSALDEVLK